MQGCDCIYHEEHEAHEEPSKDRAHHTPTACKANSNPAFVFFVSFVVN
jgi:hypothetical protein